MSAFGSIVPPDGRRCWRAAVRGHGAYSETRADNPKGPAKDQKILRGGSWFSSPGDVRVSFRNWLEPTYRNFAMGLRLF